MTNHFISGMSNKVKRHSLATLNRCLSQLKQLRIYCDYKEGLVSEDQMEKAGGLLSDFHNVIKRELNV